MRLKFYSSIVVIVLTVAALAGATLAWFTDFADLNNVFVAGTVSISADRTSHADKIIVENWNPGDKTDLTICVENEGSKSIYLRARFQERWLHSPVRLLVIYTGQTIQLLAIEWDSTCMGITGFEGPLATGDFFTDYPSNSSYFNGKFRNLSNQDYILNGIPYPTWCMDNATSIDGNVWIDDVKIFDPLWNENWHEEVPTQSRWENIPWDKIYYLLNQDYMNQDPAYTSNEIQQAIWWYTNGDYHGGYPIGDAAEIVADVEANYYLSTDNVIFDLGLDWELGPDGYWYYQYPIEGTFSGAPASERRVCLTVTITLDGPSTGNEYQGAQYLFSTFFEAIQSSQGASLTEWSWEPTP